MHAQKIEAKKTFGEYVYSQNGDRLSKRQLMDLMEGNAEAYKLMKSARNNYTWASVLGFAGGGLIGFPIGTAIGGGDAKWELAAAGAALVGVAVLVISGYNKKSKKAVDMYNANQPSVGYKFQPEFRLNVKGSGMGITMSF